jgi:hemerythrin
MVDETDMETHRQYFQTFITNTKEVQAKIQAQKSQTALVIT